MCLKLVPIISLILFIKINSISSDPAKCRNTMTDTMLTYLGENDKYPIAYYRAPTDGKCFTFGIKSQSEFYVALTEKQENLMPDTKNIISGGGVIAKILSSYSKNSLYNYTTSEFDEAGKKTPDFTYCDKNELDDYAVEYIEFWITWHDDYFKMGQMGYPESFLETALPSKFDVKFIEIMKGSSGLKIKMTKCKQCPDGTEIVYEDRFPLIRIPTYKKNLGN